MGTGELFVIVILVPDVSTPLPAPLMIFTSLYLAPPVPYPWIIQSPCASVFAPFVEIKAQNRCEVFPSKTNVTEPFAGSVLYGGVYICDKALFSNYKPFCFMIWE